jgi:hypothetical protein
MRDSLYQPKKHRYVARLWTGVEILLAALLVMTVAYTPATAAFAEEPAAGAQASDNAEKPGKPSKAEKHHKPPKARKSPNSDLPFARVSEAVLRHGISTHVPDYIAQGELRLVSVDMHLSADEMAGTGEHRAIYVVNMMGSDTVVLLAESGGQPIVYVSNRAGVLKQAAFITTGRFASKNLHKIPLADAQDGFAAEREYWIKQLASGDPVPADLASPDK